MKKIFQISFIVLLLATAGLAWYSYYLQGQVSEFTQTLDKHMADAENFKNLAASATDAEQKEKYADDFRKATRYVGYSATNLSDARSNRNTCAGITVLVLALAFGARMMGKKAN